MGSYLHIWWWFVCKSPQRTDHFILTSGSTFWFGAHKATCSESAVSIYVRKVTPVHRYLKHMADFLAVTFRLDYANLLSVVHPSGVARYGPKRQGLVAQNTSGFHLKYGARGLSSPSLRDWLWPCSLKKNNRKDDENTNLVIGGNDYTSGGIQ